MGYKVLAVLALLLIFKTSAAIAPSEKSIDVVAVEYPPFTTMLREDGGMAFALLEAASENVALELKPLFLPPARASALIESGDWCASFYPPTVKNMSKQILLSEKDVQIGLIRKKTKGPFSWKKLDELRGNTVAILRTSDASPFKNKLGEAGMRVAQVETIYQAIQMVLMGRVDFAMADNITYESMEWQNKELLELSTTSLLKTPVTLFWNKRCEDEFRLFLDELNMNRAKVE